MDEYIIFSIWMPWKLEILNNLLNTFFYEALALDQKKLVYSLQVALKGVGAVFVSVFLASYLGGMFMTPSTTVLHSIPAVRISLIVLGTAVLALVLTAVIMLTKTKHFTDSLIE
jgi:hypothetical protein